MTDLQRMAEALDYVLLARRLGFSPTEQETLYIRSRGKSGTYSAPALAVIYNGEAEYGAYPRLLAKTDARRRKNGRGTWGKQQLDIGDENDPALELERRMKELMERTARADAALRSGPYANPFLTVNLHAEDGDDVMYQVAPSELEAVRLRVRELETKERASGLTDAEVKQLETLRAVMRNEREKLKDDVKKKDSDFQLDQAAKKEANRLKLLPWQHADHPDASGIDLPDLAGIE